MRQGTNSVLGYLTNEAQTLAASGTGTVADYSPATGTFKVYFGTTDITTGVGTVYAVGTQTNCTGSINASTGVYSVTAMSADQGSLSLTATTASAYGSVVVTRVFTLSKSRAGATGTPGTNGVNAKLITVNSDRQIISYDGTGTIVAGQSVSLRTAKQNTTATVAWTVTPIGGSSYTNVSSYLTGSGTRTNLIAYSEKLGATASTNWWADTNVAITADATTAPDGTSTADLIAATTTSGIHRIARSGFGSGAIGDVVTVSVYAKANGLDYLGIVFPCVNSNFTWFNVTTGSVTITGSGWTASIADAGNGWYRCSATGTTTVASANNNAFVVSSTASSSNFSGNGTGGVYMWGAQFAVEAAVGPYIKTDGASVTAVLGDAVTMTGSQFATARAAAEGIIITATLADAAPLADSISINRVQAGANSVTGFLTNEAQLVPADSAGLVSDFSGATGTFRVFSGVSDITNGAGTTFSAVGTNCTGSINAATGVYSVTAMTQDSAILTVTAVTASAYGSVTITKVFTVAKSKAGAAGATAKLVTVSTDRQAILVDSLGALTPSGTAQSIQFTANKKNTTQTVNWFVTKLDGSATALPAASNYFSTTAAGGTGTSTGDIVYMTPTQFDAARGTTAGVIVKGEVIDGTTLNDTTSIIRVQAGANAVNGILTNENQTLASDNAGTVADYSPATGTFKMYYGSTDITTGAGTVYAVGTQTNCSGTVNASTGVYSVSAMTADNATLTLTATTSSTYGSVVITKSFSLSKSKTGAVGASGSAAKVITLLADRNTITFDNNVASPASQTTTFSVLKTNTTNTVNWTITTIDGVAVTPVATYLSAATGDTVNMTVAQFNSARGASKGLVVKATVTDGSTLSDQTSVVMLANGSTAVSAYLTNESAVLAADNAGTVSSFTSASGTFKVFYGATDITTGSSTAFSLINNTGCVATINATTGAYSITSMSADNATAQFQAVTSSTFGSVTVTKTLILAKSKAGTAGTTGAAAKTMRVSTDRQTILVDSLGNLNPSGTVQSVKFTANKQNTTNAVTWTVTKLDGTAAGVGGGFSTTQAGGTTTTTGDTVYMTPTQFDAARGATAGVIVTGAITADSLTDTVTILRLTAGASAVDGYLTNESQVLAADSAGTVTDFSQASGAFKVFYGAVDISTGSGVTYAVSTSTGCTGTINSATGAYSVTAMSADTASITYTATTTSTYGSAVVTKVFSLSKSKAGAAGSAGAAAKTIIVISDRQTVSYSSAGVATPSSQTTTFTATVQNSSSTVAWSIQDTNGNALSSSLLSAASGATTTLTAANFQAAIATNNANGVIVTGTIIDGITLSDKVSLLKVTDGAAGSPGSPGAPGADAKSISLTSTHQSFKYDTTGAIVPQTTTFTATRVNTTQTTVWNAYKADGSTLALSGTAAMVAGGTYFTGSGDTLTMTHTQFAAFLSAFATTGVVVEATVTDGSTYKARLSVVKVSDGATGPAGPGIAVTADKTQFSYIDGALSPSTQTATLTANVSGLTGTVAWSTSPNIKTGTGNTFTVNQTEFNGNSNHEVIVTATVGGQSATTSLKRGDKFSPGYLANIDATMTDTASAKSRLDAMDNNLIITKREKKVLKRIVLAIQKEYPLINTKASAMGITTELTAYQTAYSNLNTYISTTTTLTQWTVDTTIDANFDTLFDAYYDAQATVITAMHAKAGTTADWSNGVSNRPAHLTDSRIPNALDSSGNLQTPISTTVANNSHILRKTGGGLYTGDIDATKGATWGSNIFGQPTLDTFADEFNYTDMTWLQTKWTLTVPGVCSLVSTADSGGKALEIGDNSGNDTCYGFFTDFMSFVPGYTYEMAWDVEFFTSSAGASIYLGIDGVDKNSNTLGSAYNYVAASGNTNNSLLGRQTIKGYFKGTAAIAGAGPSNDPDAPSALPDGSQQGYGQGGVVKVRPMFIANYNGVAGKIRIHSVRMRRVQDWTATTSKPSNIKSLTGSEPINNLAITVDSTTGAISNIGTPGVVVDNTKQQWADVGGANKPTDNATRNITSYQTTAPANPADGDIWVDTSVGIIRIRLNGVWNVGSNYVTGTSGLTDDAGLGTKATWGNVTSRPSNLSSLTGSEAIKNNALTINTSGQITYDGTNTVSTKVIDNTKISLSAAGALAGAGGGAIAYDSIPEGTTYGKINTFEIFTGAGGGYLKLRDGTSGLQIGDCRNLPPVRGVNLGYKYGGALSVGTVTNTSAAISLSAGSINAGAMTLAYNAASKTISSLAASTSYTYFFYFSDTGYAGGTKTLNATTSNLTPYTNDAYVYMGSASFTTTASAGTTTSGGDGTYTGGGGCVEAYSWIEVKGRGWVQAHEVKAGDQIRVLKKNGNGVRWAKVLENHVQIENGYEITSESGIKVMCSSSTPLTPKEGGYLYCDQLDGHELPVLDHGNFGWEPCHAQWKGMMSVCKWLQASSPT
jgi:hypothetical protein